MARTSFTGSRDLAFSNVLYVTNSSTTPWFIPGNNNEGDNPNDGTAANRVDDCEALVGNSGKTSTITSAGQIGKAVQPNTLSDW